MLARFQLQLDGFSNLAPYISRTGAHSLSVAAMLTGGWAATNLTYQVRALQWPRAE